jgi:hypothetical protein
MSSPLAKFKSLSNQINDEHSNLDFKMIITIVASGFDTQVQNYLFILKLKIQHVNF